MADNHDSSKTGSYVTIGSILLIAIVLYIALASLLVSDLSLYPEYKRDTVSDIIAPVGRVRVVGQETEVDREAAEPPAEEETVAASAESAADSSAVDTGQRVYNSLCFSCHSTGLPNIPQLGKAAEWAARIDTGIETLYKHALEGFTGESGIPMPAKGGNPALSDDEVKAAVDYIIENSR